MEAKYETHTIAFTEAYTWAELSMEIWCDADFDEFMTHIIKIIKCVWYSDKTIEDRIPWDF